MGRDIARPFEDLWDNWFGDGRRGAAAEQGKKVISGSLGIDATARSGINVPPINLSNGGQSGLGISTADSPSFSPAGAGRILSNRDKGNNSANGEYNTSAFEYASFSLVLLADDWTGFGVIDDILIPVAYGVATGVFLYQNRELLAKQGREMARILEKAVMTPGFQYSLRAINSGNYPNVRGGTTYLNAGEVWKYGETTQGFSRYTKK